MKRTWLLVVLGALIITITGCETIKGMGKDISTVGGWLTRGSEKAQNPSEPVK